MEANMFPRPAVQAELKKMIPVKLYVDGTGEQQQAAEKNMKIQETLTNTYSLPVYAVVSPDGKLIAMHKDLERDEAKFVKFLQSR
jgi:hypothetical protein